uniref:Uncharacterized protein n=1 Tax=Candidatus Kentrum sp. DK TaxID=2126562 RepID=A0A450T579_9GAMM|nr:MAG: hypothetical protein BECKDK2373B_GA0170837_101042 [Candidatus Kentron sp. DK]VFJ61855.1 MAG: hypothetical protein BECKDK2373C_GA0170839_10925 [Candidatus Kentron sp. DK]
MNPESNNTPSPRTSTDNGAERDLNQALDALEVILKGNKAKDIQNRSKSSGTAFGDGASMEEERESFTLPDSDSEAFRSLVRQLTDEIQVIVQARMEEALRSVTKDITHQVKNHMNIMLPTLLEELANLAFHKDDNEEHQ